MSNIVVNKDAANVITYTATDTTQPEAFFFTVKRMSLPKDYILQKRLSDIEVADGVYTIRLSPEDLADIPEGAYKYDMEIIRSGEKTTSVKGDLKITSGCYDERGNRITHNLEMTRGDTKRFRFRRMNSEGEQIITAPDSMTFSVYDDGFTLFQKTLENGITLEDGVFIILINPEDTDDLELGAYDFSLNIVDMEEPSKLAEGKLTLTWEATLPENEV